MAENDNLGLTVNEQHQKFITLSAKLTKPITGFADVFARAWEQVAEKLEETLFTPERLAAIRQALAELDTPSKHQRHLEALHAIRKQQKAGKDE